MNSVTTRQLGSGIGCDHNIDAVYVEGKFASILGLEVKVIDV